MATHSSTVAWESHRQRGLVGYSLRGHKESDVAEPLTLLLKQHQKLLELMSKFSQVWDTKKIRAQKLVTNNELSKKEIKKYLEINQRGQRFVH